MSESVPVTIVYVPRRLTLLQRKAVNDEASSRWPYYVLVPTEDDVVTYEDAISGIGETQRRELWPSPMRENA